MIDSATAASARRRLAGLLPTWALLIVGVGMAVAGAIVATRPDLSITVLVVLVGCGFAAAGLARLLSAGQERRPWLDGRWGSPCCWWAWLPSPGTGRPSRCWPA